MVRDAATLLPPWIRQLTPYPPGKPIEELEREYGVTDSIKLASNENPLGPSPRALEAVREALATVHRYPDGGAYHLTRRLAAQFGLRPEHFIVGNGSNELIELVVRAFVQPGDEVVVADQAFVIYRMVVQAAGGTPRVVPLRDFTHDLPAMAAAITPRTRVVFLANPNNPTGTIYGRAAWEAFLEAIPPRVIVVADDAYAEFVEDPDYPDSVAYHRPNRLLVTLRTLSKIHGLAGLRVGYGIARPDVVQVLNRVRQPFNVNVLGQVAAVAALSDTEHVARTRETNRHGMAFLQAECRRLGLPVVPSWANFLLIEVGDGAAVYAALLRHGVIVRPMAIYRFPRHIRVTVGTMAECRRFVTSLETVLAEAATGRSSRRDAVSGVAAAAGGSPAGGDVRRPLFDTMAVVGPGLIGGSLALAAKRAGLVRRVVGCARTEATLHVARQRGLIDEATSDAGEAVAAADLVVLAVPVGALESVAAVACGRARAGTVITDVGSVKGGVVSRLDPVCRAAGCFFVGAHPVAGKETGGPAEAEAELFRGHRCILTPSPATDPTALARVRAMWEAVGMVVEEMPADVHDRVLARVSHAPHVLAYALVAAVEGARVAGRPIAPYAGSGFRDATRIAASPADLWSDIVLANRVEVLGALEEFAAHLEGLRRMIREDDGPALMRALADAQARRRALDGPARG
jgi:histidinol-phosphate aminotransferase